MSEDIVIGRKYSVVIPKRIRARLRLREGQRALMRVEAQRIIIDPFPEDPDAVLNEVLGDFSYSEAEHERLAEEELKRIARPRH